MAVVLIAVFFTARYLSARALAGAVARAEHAMLVNTISTNGHVEPNVNYQFYSPHRDHREGRVRAGRRQGTCRQAAGQAGRRGGPGAGGQRRKRGEGGAGRRLTRSTHNGTQAERQASAAEIAQERLQQDQAQHDLDALTKLAASRRGFARRSAAARARWHSRRQVWRHRNRLRSTVIQRKK